MEYHRSHFEHDNCLIEAARDADIVRDLLRNGPTMPHPKWEREQIMQHCKEQYESLHAIRRWLIQYSLAMFEDESRKSERESARRNHQ
jgi:hypothetical protein